ncbi:hypothetical protein [Dendronalium sp. ChiSLP03b]|uniref:hypothetical protein n=1 Tax=Dendronalium sp. ChiSLP03b TaxID=3075381 RepID=UPI002AD39237|nr:hypothetical protein [Dendronalium sp. ChiSLP03b]MDZ8202950.1 hypothetical protein [Dendronalium sp. ChiSLP03b]
MSSIKIGVGAAIFAGASSSLDLADPLLEPQLPELFCCHFTDIETTGGDSFKLNNA